MSIQTNFKRIALVAVASLGLGLLSAAPSTATVTTPVLSGVADGTGGTTNQALVDSLTAATITISALVDDDEDSLTVQVVPANSNAESTSVAAHFYLYDTVTNGTKVDTSIAISQELGTTAQQATKYAALINAVSQRSDTVGVINGVNSGLYILARDTNVASTGIIKATFTLQVESRTAQIIPGTYTYTINIASYDNGVRSARSTQQNLNIVISRTAAQSASISPTASSATSYVVMGNSTANLGEVGETSATTTDSAISVVATAAATDHAVVRVRLRNANSGNAQESVTAVITAGRIGDNTTMGRSVTLPYTSADVTAGYKDLVVEADGTAGTATITVSTPSIAFATKTVNFYAVAPKTLVATVPTPLLAIKSDNTDAIRITATDANGVPWTGTLYTYATTAADELIAGTSRATGTTCGFDSGTDQRFECTIVGTTAGTASITISNYATAALATAAANGPEVTATVKVVVSAAVPATVKIEFDKATYAPSERARIYVTPLDSSGKAMQSAQWTNLFAAGGISTASGLTFVGSSTTADSLTAVTITTKNNSSSTSGARAGSMEYTVFMPPAGGTVTLTATGGSGLPVAGRVALTASATVTDSGAAALAAVSALATTVASLKTLITTLTNLVLKIQKKVKA